MALKYGLEYSRFCVWFSSTEDRREREKRNMHAAANNNSPLWRSLDAEIHTAAGLRKEELD